MTSWTFDPTSGVPSKAQVDLCSVPEARRPLADVASEPLPRRGLVRTRSDRERRMRKAVEPNPARGRRVRRQAEHRRPRPIHPEQTIRAPSELFRAHAERGSRQLPDNDIEFVHYFKARVKSAPDDPSCVRLGRYVRFDPGDVKAWIASCKQPGQIIDRGATKRQKLARFLRPPDDAGEHGVSGECIPLARPVCGVPFPWPGLGVSMGMPAWPP
jgi:hypothetical protein